MRRPAIAGLCLVGVCLTGMMGASATLAALPEVGRCNLVEGIVEGSKTVYHGGYTTSGCTKVSATKTGKYEWTPGPGVDNRFTGTAKSTLIADAYQGVAPFKATITCHTSTVAGEYAGPTMVSARFTLTGCEWKEAKEDCGELEGCLGGAHGVCQSEGSAAGEIKTAPLAGELGFITTGAKPRLGIRFASSEEGSPFAAYKCGTASMSLVGSVIGSVLPEKMYATSKLTFTGVAGEQKP
jgi:hypothetical protein